MTVKDEYNTADLFAGALKVWEKSILNYWKNFSGYNNDARDVASTYFHLFSKILVNPETFIKVANHNLKFMVKQQQLFSDLFYRNSALQEKDDRRFSSEEWHSHPYFLFAAKNHLLLEELWNDIIDSADLERRHHKKTGFYTRQFLDAFAPSNFLLTNPEVLKEAIASGGRSLLNGFSNFINDVEEGEISQTDATPFRVGKNLATTEGTVVFENELMQLIQYKPRTEKVHSVPLLIIPPWINKYYILDLQPEKSFIRFMLEQGMQVFAISWRNPDSEMGSVTFDDYVAKGAINAIDVASGITGSKKVNALGYCLGGTLLSVASAVLAASRKETPVNSITLLAAMIDFSDIGPMGDVIDSALVKKMQRGELLVDGLMPGHTMEKAFNLIRAKDLIWFYVINNYLKGKKPPPFDVLYWTNDNTNLPAGMYVYYLREMVLENRLSRKNALRICDTPIDIGLIDVPVFIFGFKEDYISPPQTVFTATELVSGKAEFILGGSGHVIGVVNPPQKNKYGFWVNGEYGKGYDHWRETAEYREGSWWPEWSAKLKKISGVLKSAPAFSGSKKYPPLEPAPGSYVLNQKEITELHQ